MKFQLENGKENGNDYNGLYVRVIWGLYRGLGFAETAGDTVYTKAHLV